MPNQNIEEVKKALMKDSLNSEEIKQVFEFFEKSNNLRTLNLIKVKVSNVGFSLLMSIIAKNVYIETLCLNAAEIDGQNINLLCAALLLNHKIKTIAVSEAKNSNQIQGVIKMAKNLGNRSLQTVRVNDVEVNISEFNDQFYAQDLGNKFLVAYVITGLKAIFYSVCLLHLEDKNCDFFVKIANKISGKKYIEFNELVNLFKSENSTGKSQFLSLAFIMHQNISDNQIRVILQNLPIEHLSNFIAFLVRTNSGSDKILKMINKIPENQRLEILFNALIKVSDFGASSGQFIKILQVISNAYDEDLSLPTMSQFLELNNSQIQLQNFISAISEHLKNEQHVNNIVHNALVKLVSENGDETQIRLLMDAAIATLKVEDFHLIMSNTMADLVKNTHSNINNFASTVSEYFTNAPENMMLIISNAALAAAESDCGKDRLKIFFNATFASKNINKEAAEDIMSNVIMHLIKVGVTSARLQNLFDAAKEHLNNNKNLIRGVLVNAMLFAKIYPNETKYIQNVIDGLVGQILPQEKITQKEIAAQEKAERELIKEEDGIERKDLLKKQKAERHQITILQNKLDNLKKNESASSIAKPVNEVHVEKSAIGKFCDQRMAAKTDKKSFFRNAVSFSEEIQLFKSICDQHPPSNSEKLILAQNLSSIFFIQNSKRKSYFLEDQEFKINSDMESLGLMIRGWCSTSESEDKKVKIAKSLILLNFHMEKVRMLGKLVNDPKYDVVQDKKSKGRAIVVDGKELSRILPSDYKNHIVITKEYKSSIEQLGECLTQLNTHVGGNNSLPWDYLGECVDLAKSYEDTQEKFLGQWLIRYKINAEFKQEGRTFGFPATKSGKISYVSQVNALHKKTFNSERKLWTPTLVTGEVCEKVDEIRQSEKSPQPLDKSAKKEPTDIRNHLNTKRFEELLSRIEEQNSHQSMSDLFKKAQSLFKDFDCEVNKEEEDELFIEKQEDISVEDAVDINLEILKTLQYAKRSAGEEVGNEELLIAELKNFPDLKAYNNLGGLIDGMENNVGDRKLTEIDDLRSKRKNLENPIRNRILEITIDCLSEVALFKSSQGKNIDKDLSVFYELSCEISSESLSQLGKTALESFNSAEFAQVKLEYQDDSPIKALFNEKPFLVQNDNFGYFLQCEEIDRRIAINPQDITAGIIIGGLHLLNKDVPDAKPKVRSNSASESPINPLLGVRNRATTI
ncbi:MAG: hypothetical protein ACJAW3_000862 [Lentimonas sp.]|jgi:hypothetical protein